MRASEIEEKLPDGEISQIDDSKVKLEAAELTNEVNAMAADLKFIDLSFDLSSLVSANSLRDYPIHRWYYYKEGFSPGLPKYVINKLGTGETRTVVDTFAGVGTTALSLLSNPSTSKVIGVEYSPFASFVASTKLNASTFDPRRLARYVGKLMAADTDSSSSAVPGLSAFHNPEIFDPAVVRQLLTIRDQVATSPGLSATEQMFFLVGIAAIAEDVSGAMKDGRALRVLRGRQRRRQGLIPRGGVTGQDVRTAVSNQWLAMIEDVEKIDHNRRLASAIHIRGDARSLGELTDSTGSLLIPSESVGLFVYSPPYLNCLDYTEVYKIELWLLGLVSNRAELDRKSVV